MTGSGASTIDAAAPDAAASSGASPGPDASDLDGNASGSASGSGADTGTGLPRKSAGCGKVVADSPTAWTTHDIMVTVDPQFAPLFTQRRYFTRPPPNYDANKAYPLTIWGQGCGQTVAETTPITQGPGAAASIQVQMLAKKPCYSAGPDGDNANSPELPYFDLVLAQAEAEFCIDETKVFMGGYSSGGWFTSLISCTRTNVVRGVAWVAAGLQLNHAPCAGPVAALVTVGSADPGTPMAQAIAGRDSIIMRNGCGTTTVPWDPGETTFDSSSCVSYQGCMPGYPVVWCLTPGGHSNGLNTGLSSKGFWKLWSSLP
jgi:hypothetical protein